MNWLLLAFLAAFATSLTTISSKVGLREVNSNFATLIKTAIVVIFSALLCLFTGSYPSFASFSPMNWVYLCLSGIATGASWLCYHKALKLGDVNKVVPIDKCSFVLTSILFLIFFFDETSNHGDLATILALSGSIVLMLVGTLLMIEPKKEEKKETNRWYLLFAILSATFASLVALFAKLGLRGVDSNLASLSKTVVVFFFALGIVLFKKDYKDAKKITPKSWVALVVAGLATGIAWVSEFAAYSLEGSNAVAINSIGKLSILLTMLFSMIVLKEKFSLKALIGLALLIASIVVIIIFSL